MKALIDNKDHLKFSVFLFYLTLVLYLYFYFIKNYCLSSYLGNYAISDLLIHYNGQFIRRGLIGSLLLLISDLTEFNLKEVIKFTFVGIYLIYFIIYFFFIKDLIKKNLFVFLFILLSPLGILYPLYELESLLRKEIFLYIFFLIFLILLKSNLSNKVYYIYLNLILPLLILIHDGLIFFISVFFLAWSIQKQKYDLKIKIKHLLFSSITALMVIILNINYLLSADIVAHVEGQLINLSSYGYNVTEFGAFFWLRKDLFEAISINFSNYNLNHLIRYFIIFLLSFSPVIYLWKKVVILNFYSKIIFLLTILSIFSLFLIVLDWGRFITVVFNLFIFLLVFYVYLFKEYEKIYFKNKITYLFILLIYCSFWNPKTTFLEKINFLPPKDVIERIIDYSTI